MRICVETDNDDIVIGYGICLSEGHIPLDHGTLIETEIDPEKIIGNYKLLGGELRLNNPEE